MDGDEVFLIIIIMILGGIIGAGITMCVTPNLEADIGLSQEAGDLVCQKLTNNTDALAVDWNHRADEPRDSLICKIEQQRIEGGLIQIIGN